MFFNVLLAGLVAFKFFEPIADQLDPMFTGTPLLGYEDVLCLMGLFCPTLMLLRFVTNLLFVRQIEFDPRLDQIGAISPACSRAIYSPASCSVPSRPYPGTSIS